MTVQASAVVCSILVIDDDPLTETIINEAVSDIATVRRAVDAASGCALIAEYPPTIILLALDWRGTDAINLCDSLFKTYGITSSSVIGLSQRYDPACEANVIRAGSSGILYKPISAALARLKIQMQIAQRQSKVTNDYESSLPDTRIGLMGNYFSNGKIELHASLGAVDEAVVMVNAEGNVTYMNPAAEQLTGCSAGQSIGRSIDKVMRLHDIESNTPCQNPAYTAMTEAKAVKRSTNNLLCGKDNQRMKLEHWAVPVINQSGLITGAAVVFQDISGARELTLRMNHLSHHDLLTNLPNRLLLQDRIDQALNRARRAEDKVALVAFDFDNFKRVNDTFGYTVGDQLLQDIARCLEKIVRHADTVCRLGGDEFIILLTDINTSEQVVQFIRRLFEVFSRTWWVGPHAFDLTLSIGISLFPDDSDNTDELHRHADAAMYSAKKQGRNHYQFFSDDIEIHLRLKRALEEHLRDALEHDVFEIHYQPQIDVIQDKITGFEALVRWRKPDGELVAPMTFIPLAEESGLIVPLGKLILLKACNQARQWTDQGHQLRMAINISPVQFDDEQFINSVAETLLQSKVSPRLIEFEITESFLIKDVDRAKRVIHELKELGICIALDDFGTGYSSLSYLKTLPFDVLKIDQSFIKNMLDSNVDIAIIKAIIQMASGLNLHLVAEGVETKAHVDQLTQLGCRTMQGYFFSRPVPAVDMDKILMCGKLF